MNYGCQILRYKIARNSELWNKILALEKLHERQMIGPNLTWPLHFLLNLWKQKISLYWNSSFLVYLISKHPDPVKKLNEIKLLQIILSASDLKTSSSQELWNKTDGPSKCVRLSVAFSPVSSEPKSTCSGYTQFSLYSVLAIM